MRKMETALTLSKISVLHCNSDDEDVVDDTIFSLGKPSKTFNKKATYDLDCYKISFVNSLHRKSRKSDKFPKNVLVLTLYEYKSLMDNPCI